jgi:WD40 repeat protein
MAVWDLNEDKITTLFKGELNTNGVNTVLFLPDSKRLVSGHNDNTIRVWDLSKKKELRRLVGHTDWVSALACTEDGKTLASSSDGIDPVIRLWNPDDGRQIGQLQKDTCVISWILWID